MRLARLVLAVVMGCTALAACNEAGGVKPSTVVSASDSADQVLYGFVHFLTRDGVREGQVEADTAYFYDPTQTTMLRNMKLVFIDSAGNENATITSKVGTYKWQTGNMTADTNVVLRSHDGRVLKSEQLLYDATKKELTTPLFFTFDKDADHIEGKGFRSDLNFEHVVVNQPVGTAKDGFLLPGQEKEDSTEKADSTRQADSTRKAGRK
jgi:LPS export ABC transporter protein LptC